MFDLYSDVILLKDIPEDNLQAGDIGCVVDYHGVKGLEMGYSVEFFDLLGNTVALITVPCSWLRKPHQGDRATIRKDALLIT
ncbi:MAG: DUF4926 domain-containing protein [Cyanobacteria bacterium]|nr:DUF4926 domain-containing protein [Cyanobacteria bacterium CG_2015-16_32_12]NCO77336.1 DUF4926 domain-containing protein [Cyanobacteria bacterium CG_2015-22_32_23]NCQ05499.1 DUF4926 domain-containing protein [Cyanobacteria bacterium CG_2015-09_32_10]NCQ42218.1 DUF4926 domain-containing protein [Cyanobacteria bacterium CG_2015-04_32_10]NCS84183.1 DUF4926 domain-containing protein [Cyanobacteria bacterium CG_2015-02_32_10]